MQLETLLPLGLALACPISMLLMMRMSSAGKTGCHSAGESEPTPARAESAEERRAKLLEQRQAIDAELGMLRGEVRASAPLMGRQPLAARHDG